MRRRFPKVDDCCHVGSLMKLQFERGEEISLTPAVASFLPVSTRAPIDANRAIVMLNPIGQKKKKRMPKVTHSKG